MGILKEIKYKPGSVQKRVLFYNAAIASGNEEEERKITAIVESSSVLDLNIHEA